MNPRSSKRVPEPIANIDIRSLPLRPADAFVLSRIDGTADATVIAASTGLDAPAVMEALERLIQLGAIRWNEGAGQAQVGPTAQAPPQHAVRGSDLDEQVDLDPERKAQILNIYGRLEKLNHYELLGIDTNADRKAVKSAYYKVVNVYHPDRYFGKNLGSYKRKLEVIFERLTEAQEVLSRRSARKDYDAYLERQCATRNFEHMLDGEAHAHELEKLEEQIRREAQAGVNANPDRVSPRSPHPAPPARSPSITVRDEPSAPPSSPPAGPLRLSEPFRPSAAPEVRRRSLARKLFGSPSSSLRPQSAAKIAVSAPPSGNGVVISERPSGELRRLFDQHSAKLRDSKIEALKKDAQAALEQNKAVAAANSLRLAVSLAPGDRALCDRLRELERLAAAEMSDAYLEQAQYEERAGRLTDAARSYERSARGKPAVQSLEGAARCLLESKGDLRLAADLARKALDLAPDSAGIRLTLGRVFLAAGMRTSAVRELERASGLAPNDMNIRNWLRRAQRGQS